MKRSVMAIVATVSLLTAMAPAVASGANRDDLVNNQRAQSAKISQLKADLEGVSEDLRTAAVELQATRDQIPAAEAELATAEQELFAAQRKAQAKAALLDAAQSELAGIHTDLAASTEKVADAQKSLAELARSTYRGETTPSTFDILVNSATAEEFMNAYRVNEALTRSQTTALAQLEQTAGQTKNREARQSAVQERVSELKAEADQLVNEQQEKQQAAQAKRDALAMLEQTIAEKSAILEQRKGEVEAEVSAEQAQYNQISAEIAQIDAQNRASGGGSSSSGSWSGSGGFIQAPIRTTVRVTSPFGYRIHPILGYRKMHYGVDLSAACGLPQYAAAPGTVTSAGWYGSGGNTITINHGMYNGSSYVTRYMHFGSLAVSVGQRVDRNTVIGYTGTTGGSTGCHVHFEVWQNGSAQNPMNYIG